MFAPEREVNYLLKHKNETEVLVLGYIIFFDCVG